MNSNDTGKVDSPELIDMLGARFEVVARMGQSDGDTALIRARMAAGKTVPLHSHIDPECFYVLSGEIEVFVAGETPRWHVVEIGRSLLVADGIKHAVRNTGDETADLILATNNRLARYFREAGRPVTSSIEPRTPSPEDVQRMIQVSEAYGYWLASPGESAATIEAVESENQ